LGNVFSTLNAHISALGELGEEEALRELYFNSILHEPIYFPYSGIMQADLVELHSQSRP
jgi:hypothetical protein